MSDAYERESYVPLSSHPSALYTWMLTPSNRQNNALLNSLAQKTSALKSVTIDIYDNARNHETIDNTVLPPPPILPALGPGLLTFLGDGIEWSILKHVHESPRERIAINPCRARGRQGRRYEGCGDLCWDWSWAVGCFGVGFLNIKGWGLGIYMDV